MAGRSFMPPITASYVASRIDNFVRRLRFQVSVFYTCCNRETNNKNMKRLECERFPPCDGPWLTCPHVPKSVDWRPQWVGLQHHKARHTPAPTPTLKENLTSVLRWPNRPTLPRAAGDAPCASFGRPLPWRRRVSPFLRRPRRSLLFPDGPPPPLRSRAEQKQKQKKTHTRIMLYIHDTNSGPTFLEKSQSFAVVPSRMKSKWNRNNWSTSRRKVSRLPARMKSNKQKEYWSTFFEKSQYFAVLPSRMKRKNTGTNWSTSSTKVSRLPPRIQRAKNGIKTGQLLREKSVYCRTFSDKEQKPRK